MTRDVTPQPKAAAICRAVQQAMALTEKGRQSAELWTLSRLGGDPRAARELLEELGRLSSQLSGLLLTAPTCLSLSSVALRNPGGGQAHSRLAVAQHSPGDRMSRLISLVLLWRLGPRSRAAVAADPGFRRAGSPGIGLLLERQASDIDNSWISALQQLSAQEIRQLSEHLSVTAGTVSRVTARGAGHSRTVSAKRVDPLVRDLLSGGPRLQPAKAVNWPVVYAALRAGGMTDDPSRRAALEVLRQRLKAPLRSPVQSEEQVQNEERDQNQHPYVQATDTCGAPRLNWLAPHASAQQLSATRKEPKQTQRNRP